jgi:hypothetical protein
LQRHLCDHAVNSFTIIHPILSLIGHFFLDRASHANIVQLTEPDATTQDVDDLDSDACM